MLGLFAGAVLAGCMGGLITGAALAWYILWCFLGAVLYTSSGLCPGTALVLSFHYPGFWLLLIYCASRSRVTGAILALFWLFPGTALATYLPCLFPGMTLVVHCYCVYSGCAYLHAYHWCCARSVLGLGSPWLVPSTALAICIC
ncbi:hypothetical protein BDW60DRAFT_212817 [Aspergillus nidulans var. acristatus]